MKIIEAMKRVKANKEKIADLQLKIAAHCVNLSIETPLYGAETKDKVNEWLQSCTDTTQENIRLLCAIAKTNLATVATILLGGKPVAKTLAEWIWRRREYAKIDLDTWLKVGDRNLRDQFMQPTASGGMPTEIKVVRHYDPEQRDRMVAMFKTEAHEIDSALEVVNAITDLIE